MTTTDESEDTNAALKRRWIAREFGALLEEMNGRIAQERGASPDDLAALRDELAAIVARLEQADAQDRALTERLEGVESLAGDAARFEDSTTAALVEALRRAGVRDPERLSSSLSPFIVNSIRAEIENSREAVADALYPVLGRMIRLSIAESMAELTRKVENSLPFERWWAAISAKLTGRSALAGYAATPFSIREALLIDRASGTLVAQRSVQEPDGEPEESRDPELAGAMIATLVAFAEDALAEDGDSVKQIALSDSRFYLRASPGAILAMRGVGEPPPGLARRLDTVFETFLERMTHTGPDTPPPTVLLEDMRREGEDVARPPRVPLYNRPVFIGLGFVAFVAFAFWLNALANAARIAGWEEKLEAAIDADPRLTGFPLDHAITREGDVLTITGLAPDLAALSALRERVGGLGVPLAGTPLEIEWNVTTLRVERITP